MKISLPPLRILLTLAISTTSLIFLLGQEPSPGTLHYPPHLDGYGKYLRSLMKKGKAHDLAVWFDSKNRYLKSSDYYVMAAQFYAQAGMRDSAAQAIVIALDNGLTNSKILSRNDSKIDDVDNEVILTSLRNGPITRGHITQKSQVC